MDGGQSICRSEDALIDVAEAHYSLEGGVPVKNENEVVGCAGAPATADQLHLDIGAQGPYEVLYLAHK